MLDRSQAPHITNSIDTDIQIPQVEKRDLMTGIPLYYYKGGTQEVFQLQLNTPCGTWMQDKALQVLMMTSLMKQGTASHSSAEISQMLDFYGASLVVGYSADRLTITLTGLSEYMLDLIDIFTEVVLEPNFQQKEFDNFLARTKQQYLLNKTKSDYIANRQLNADIFGKEHPYGAFFDEADFDRIKLRDVQKFFDEKFSLKEAKFFLAGNFSEDSLTQAEEKLNLVLMRGDASPKWTYRPHMTSELNQSMIIKVDALQSAVCTGRTIMHWAEDDYLAMVVLNTALGGYFGSRLMSNIREDKGYTYGIYSQMTSYAHETMWEINTDVNRDVAEDTLHQIKVELDKLMQDLIPEDELLTVKNYLFSGMMSSIDGPFKIMSRWKTYILNGVDEKRFELQKDTYKNVTSEELRTLAQKYFHDKDRVKLVVS